jgi:hypothetical protein
MPQDNKLLKIYIISHAALTSTSNWAYLKPFYQAPTFGKVSLKPEALEPCYASGFVLSSLLITPRTVCRLWQLTGMQWIT